MKRTIEIEDNLQEIISDCQDELKEAVIEWLDDNKNIEPTEAPCLYNDIDYNGRFHEIIDSAVPIYTYEIESLWFLYKSEFEEAYENAGFGDNPLENNGMTAIYCYLQQEVSEWYEDNKDEIFEEWEDSQKAEA